MLSQKTSSLKRSRLDIGGLVSPTSPGDYSNIRVYTRAVPEDEVGFCKFPVGPAVAPRKLNIYQQSGTRTSCQEVASLITAGAEIPSCKRDLYNPVSPTFITPVAIWYNWKFASTYPTVFRGPISVLAFTKLVAVFFVLVSKNHHTIEVLQEKHHKTRSFSRPKTSLQ